MSNREISNASNSYPDELTRRSDDLGHMKQFAVSHGILEPRTFPLRYGQADFELSD